MSTSSPSRGGRKRKSQTVRQLTSVKKAAPVPVAASQTGEFADIHLPEVEQYRQIYGATMNNMCKYISYISLCVWGILRLYPILFDALFE